MGVDSPDDVPHHGGFGLMDRVYQPSSHAREHNQFLILPHWFAIALGATPTMLLSLRLVRRGRRAASGRCATCGYDLRATPERCPECGMELDIAAA
jgi:hypothetical protein